MSGDEILLSVVIPVYNGGAEPIETVSSVFEAGCESVEILLVDDGSEDETARVCGQLAEGDGRIVFLRQAHRGAAWARNLGLEHARGRYVAFLDHDDRWIKGFFDDSTLDLLRRDRADVLIFGSCTANLEMTRCSRRCVSAHRASGPEALLENWGHYGGMLFGREHLASLGLMFCDIRYSEDVLFAARAIGAADEAAFVERYLHVYRQRPGSLTKSRGTRADAYYDAFCAWMDHESCFVGAAALFFRDMAVSCGLCFLERAMGEGGHRRAGICEAVLDTTLTMVRQGCRIADRNRLTMLRDRPFWFRMDSRLRVWGAAIRTRLYAAALLRRLSDRMLLSSPLPCYMHSENEAPNA